MVKNVPKGLHLPSITIKALQRPMKATTEEYMYISALLAFRRRNFQEGTQSLTIIKLMFSEKATSKITQLVLTGFFASHQFRTNVELSFFIFDKVRSI